MRSQMAIVVLLLSGAVSMPAAGAGDYDGSFVTVELRNLTPSGLDNDWVLADDDAISLSAEHPTGKIDHVDFSSEMSLEFTVGQNFGGRSGWGASYWSFDETASEEKTAPQFGALFPVLLTPIVAFEPMFEDALDPFIDFGEAAHRIRSETLDIFYWRTAIDQEKFEMRWQVGLRYASLESELRALYSGEVTVNGDTWSRGDPFLGDAELESKMDGFGGFVGIDGEVRLGGSFTLHGGMSYAMIVGGVDSSYVIAINPDPFFFPPFDAPGVTREDDRVIGIVDLSLGFGLEVGKRWKVIADYEFSKWTEAVDQLLFPSAAFPGFVDADSTDVDWDGITLGATVDW